MDAFKRAAAVVVFAVGLFSIAAAQNPTSVITVDHGPNAASQINKHYVVLVSLDGFRYDYPKKYGAPHLLAIGAEGASVPQGMIPSYPSLTFPNHLAIVTGLYPEHHGIVANSFYDPARKAYYKISDTKVVRDGSWYSGTPLWVLAEQQGMRSACFFWPGSEAAIQGVRPTYYLHYTDSIPGDKRIGQVIDWLKLPPAQRPHFITLYYPDVDENGHKYGPDSPQTEDAVHYVDQQMGELETRLKALHLPIDLIIVSDHGMQKLSGDWVNLDQYADLSHFHTDGPLLYPDTDADAQKAFEQFKKAIQSGRTNKFRVYRRADVPAHLHYNANAREGDPIIVPTGPYSFRAHASGKSGDLRPDEVGAHGFDPRRMKTMRAVFFAEGPDIRRGVKLKPFENVNVYPLIAQILGLTTMPVDGKLSTLQRVLVKPEMRARTQPVAGN